MTGYLFNFGVQWTEIYNLNFRVQKIYAKIEKNNLDKKYICKATI